MINNYYLARKYLKNYRQIQNNVIYLIYMYREAEVLL